MRPFGLDEAERLRYARAYAEMLRREWQTANQLPQDRPTGLPRLGAGGQFRRMLGGALVDVGRRLVPADPSAVPSMANAGVTDGGC
jgi:hypothetical protein